MYTAGTVGTWTITGTYTDSYAFTMVTVIPELPSSIIGIGSIPNQIYRKPFNLTITTLNKQGKILSYSGTLTLSDSTGSIVPQVVSIVEGVWTGTVSINKSMLNNQITLEIAGGNGTTSNLFDVLINAASIETITDGKAVLEIKPNSVSNENYYLEIIPTPSGYEINNANRQIGTSSILPDTLCEIKGSSATNEKLTFFEQAIPLSLVYSSNLDNILDNIDENTLQIYRLQNGQWLPVHGNVYLKNNMVTALIDKPGIFIIRGVAYGKSLSDVVVYPNPCKDAEITFLHANDSTIEIYDLAGDLLKRVHVQEAKYSWDTRDNSGKLLDSGVYIYVIIGKTESRCGKVVIIR
jgi:hypothetical protein